jgi:DNA-binding transcriptional LysR family regulator
MGAAGADRVNGKRAALRGLDITTLRLFLAAVEEGNLAKAAEREHIAISAISRRISDLEARWGVQLLERHDRGVVATAAGKGVVAQIREALGVFTKMLREIEEIQGGARGFIRVQAHMTEMAGPLPGAVAAFLRAHPSVEIEIDEGTSLDIYHSISVGAADVGLISGTIKRGNLHFIPWMQDELVALLPPAHPLERHSTLVFADLVEYPFISMQRDSSLLALYRAKAMEAGLALRERSHATSFESVRRMVSEGLGVAILPSLAATSTRGDDNVHVRPLSDSWAHRSLVICVRDPASLSAATRRLIEHLRSTAANVSA